MPIAWNIGIQMVHRRKTEIILFLKWIDVVKETHGVSIFLLLYSAIPLQQVKR